MCARQRESKARDSRNHLAIDVTTDPREDWAQAQARAAICVQPVDAHVCPAIRKPTRISLRSSSTHDPSDPPPRVVLTLTDLHAAAAEMTVQSCSCIDIAELFKIPVAMVRLRRAFTRARESLNRLTTVARQWLSRPVDDAASTVWGRYPTVSIRLSTIRDCVLPGARVAHLTPTWTDKCTPAFVFVLSVSRPPCRRTIR